MIDRVEGGELFDRVVSLGLLEESLAKMLFYQMVLGVKVRRNLINRSRSILRSRTNWRSVGQVGAMEIVEGKDNTVDSR